MLRHLIAPIAVLVVLAGPVSATEEPIFPMLYNVHEVAEDDVLNIRAAPNTKSEIIGTLDHDATNVEVVEERDGWGRVNSGEGSGWVSMRFMAYPFNPWQENGTPELMRCFGTEPFWHAAVDLPAKEIRLVNLAEGEVVDVQTVTDVIPGPYRTPTRAILANDFTLMTTPAQCSDGMSDQLYGMAAYLITDQATEGATPRMLNGCCSVTHTLTEQQPEQ